MTASDSDLAQMSPENYLVARSRLLRGSPNTSPGSVNGTDSAASKAWLLTAQLLFPQSMDIQREAYTVRRLEMDAAEAEGAKVKEAAKYLNHIIARFGVDGDQATKEELSKIVSALHGEPGSDPRLSTLFDALPEETQEKILLHVANASSDTLVYAKNMQYFFKRFPDKIPVLGGNFLSTILTKFKSGNRPMGIVGPRDPLHHALVHEIFPNFLSVSTLKLGNELLQSILHVTLQYCHGYMSDLRSRRGSGPLSDLWKVVLSYFEEIGLRMSWVLSDGIIDASQDALWKRIRVFSAANHKLEALSQLFYVCSILLFKTTCEFIIEARGLRVESNNSTIEAATVSEPLILVEAFMKFDYEQYQNSSDPAIKRRRMTTDSADKTPLLTHGEQIGEEKSSLIRAFNHSLNYFNLIFDDNGRKNKLANCLGDPNAFSFFAADALHYMGDFRAAIQHVRVLSSPTASPVENLRNNLKLATLQFSNGDHATAVHHIVLAVVGCRSLPTSNTASANSSKGKLLTQTHLTKNRHIRFMEFTKENILAYCVRILIYELKDRAMLKDRDQTIGHILVLLQYLHPREPDIYEEMLHHVRRQKGLNYPLFCSYIVHIAFLEDFAYFASQQDFNLMLSHSLATPTENSSSRRVGTRGANRGEKEEVRAAIKRQVLRSHESLDDVIIDFFETNRDSVLSLLL